MKIVVAVRCYNEIRHIERFIRGYNFADAIVVSDGGSTDGSVELLKKYPKVKLLHFTQQETRHGHTWNPDAPHMNYVLDWAKALDPTWLIFDDMDCVPTKDLRENARELFEEVYFSQEPQINVFRLYLWGETGNYFPHMNRNFEDAYRSVWAWNPNKINVRADESVRHGTLMGLAPHEKIFPVKIPYCLLHRSWYPDTIDAKIEHYNKLGLPMTHPLLDKESYGEMQPLPSWAVE